MLFHADLEVGIEDEEHKESMRGINALRTGRTEMYSRCK
jgi:hypothetical protein